jgi:hypothetical protein
MVEVNITFKYTASKQYITRLYKFDSQKDYDEFVENANKDHSIRKIIGITDKE